MPYCGHNDDLKRVISLQTKDLPSCLPSPPVRHIVLIKPQEPQHPVMGEKKSCHEGEKKSFKKTTHFEFFLDNNKLYFCICFINGFLQDCRGGGGVRNSPTIHDFFNFTQSPLYYWISLGFLKIFAYSPILQKSTWKFMPLWMSRSKISHLISNVFLERKGKGEWRSTSVPLYIFMFILCHRVVSVILAFHANEMQITKCTFGFFGFKKFASVSVPLHTYSHWYTRKWSKMENKEDVSMSTLINSTEATDGRAKGDDERTLLIVNDKEKSNGSSTTASYRSHLAISEDSKEYPSIQEINRSLYMENTTT